MRERLAGRSSSAWIADDCAVIIWGEFGRTPKISNIVGRDHWPQVNCAFMAGGKFKHGQVIGATDKIAGEAVSRPVTYGEVYATLFRHLGIDVDNTTVTDNRAAPRPPPVPRRKRWQATSRIDIRFFVILFFVRSQTI